MNELIEKYHNLVAQLIPQIVKAMEENDDGYDTLCAKKKIYLQFIEELESLDHSKKLF